MRFGLVELAPAEPATSESLNGDVAWRTTPTDLWQVLSQTPVDAIIFHVQIDDRYRLVESIHDARSLTPSTRLLLATNANAGIMVAEINSAPGPGWRLGGSVLTARERQVLEEVRSGRTNREIASLLGIALSTANRHVENILKKLSVRNRTQAVAEAAGLGYQTEPNIVDARDSSR